MGDPRLRLGDIVRLSITEVASSVMYMRGEGHVQGSLTAVAADARQGADSDFLFQIVPELSHQAVNEQRNLKMLQRRPSFSRSQSSSGSFASSQELKEKAEQQESMVAGLVKAETLKNRTIIAALESDRSALRVVEFHDTVQLRHVNSGRFVTRSATSLRLELAARDDASSVFKLLPRHAFRGEGDAVLLNDELCFESPEAEGITIMLGHDLDPLEGGLPLPGSSERASSGDSPVKALLLSENEASTDGSGGAGGEGVGGGANSVSTADRAGTSFRLELHSRVDPDERGCVMHGTPVRLWHSDSSCYLTASSAQTASDLNDAFLQRTSDGETSTSTSQSPNAVWAIEPVAPPAAAVDGAASQQQPVGFAVGGVLK